MASASRPRGGVLMSLLLAFFLLFQPTFSQKACYYPDGTTAPHDAPCNSNTPDGNSFCCQAGYACLSNGLCGWTAAAGFDASMFARGSCTDRTFKSSSCPNFCNLPGTDPVNTWDQMSQCNGTQNEWYCGVPGQSAGADCAGNQKILTFAAPFSTVSIVGGGSSSTNTAVSQPTQMSINVGDTTSNNMLSVLSSSSSAVTSTPGSPTPSSPSPTTVYLTMPGQSGSPTPTPTPGSSPSPGFVPSSAGANSQNNNAVAIGVGVGVGIGGAMLLAAIAL